MTSIPRGTPMIQMRRILDSAVILSWKDLLRPSQRGLIQVEYVPGTHYPYLRIWQLTGKGEWSLVCNYCLSHRPKGSTGDETTFSNGYHSTNLAAMLRVIHATSGPICGPAQPRQREFYPSPVAYRGGHAGGIRMHAAGL
jgi:hypothetical protein